MSITSSLTENFLPHPSPSTNTNFSFVLFRKTDVMAEFLRRSTTLQHRWMIEIRDQRYTITK